MGHTAHRNRRAPQQDRRPSQDSTRWTHHASYRLRHQSALPQTDRRSVRLDQELRGSGQGEAAGTRPRRCRFYAGARGLQLDPLAQAVGGVDMSVRGKWRLVETPDYDMAGPSSYILFAKDGGEFALDCLTGSIHDRCQADPVEFTWSGSDEMEPASGHGWAEKQDDGSLQGEICLEGGDDIPFVA